MREGQRTGLGGRGRGRGVARNRSPSPSKIRDHRSGYHNNPHNSQVSHHQSRHSLSPPADRRGQHHSLNPMANRPHRSPVPRGSPIEHRGERDYTLRRPEHGERDYTSRRPEHRERDYTLRRPEHGERDYTLRRLEHGNHRPTSFHDEGIDFQHKYMLPEHPTDLSDVHAMLKSSRTIKDKDFAGSSSGIDSQGMLVQKSLFLDDGSKHTFYTQTHDLARPFDSSALNSSGNMRSIGSGSGLNAGMPTHDQRVRDPYDDREREKLYSRDVSFPVMPPPSQTRPFVSTISSSFPKDTDALRIYGDRGDAGKFLDGPLEHNGYNQAQFSDHMRRAPVSPPARDERLEYGYNEAGRGGRDDHGYIPSDGLFHKTVYGLRDEDRDANSKSFSELAGGRADRDNAYHKRFSEGSFWDQHYSVDGGTCMDFCDLEGVREDYVGSSGSGYVGFGLKALRDRELPPFEESFCFGKGVTPVAYRERPNSYMLVDNPFDAFRHRVSSPREQSRLDADFDDFDASREEMLRKNYVITDDLNGQDVHRRVRSPSYGDETWSNEEYEYVEESRRFLHPKKPINGHCQYGLSSRKLLRNDGRGVTNDSSAWLGGGRGISLKKRLRPGPSDLHDSVASERRQEFYRPHKVWKRGQEDRNSNLNAPDGDIPYDAAHHMKKDPSEDSVEFKQQVHKAFLRFSKLLNESPRQQKRFRDDQEKSSKLLCCVCGSLSKEFVDVHSLLTHSYHSLKAGLRTDHLGLHKALCVLNGWNWLLAPDTSKSYRRRAPSELKALKEDLIVWPPVVIIYSSSIGNKSITNGPKVESVERMEEMLKEMGFGAGKTRVSRGKPANQSVHLVKFMPTLSGLQEAERLHKYYADNNRGRERLQQITSNSGSSSDGKARVEKDEELFYGYMAVAEDLDKLDPETKKRSLVKSKKEIEAIADAPLK